MEQGSGDVLQRPHCLRQLNWHEIGREAFVPQAVAVRASKITSGPTLAFPHGAPPREEPDKITLFSLFTRADLDAARA